MSHCARQLNRFERNALNTMDKRKLNKGRPVGMTREKMDQMAQARMDERAANVPPGPGNKRVRPERQEEVRAKIQASHIVRRLQMHGDGLLELTPTQIKSYEILLNKSLSTLQATEITEVSNRDKMTEAEIMAKISELIRREPRLADMVQLRGVVDVPLEPSAAPVSSGDGEAVAGDGTCTACGAPVQWGVCAGCGAVVGV